MTKINSTKHIIQLIDSDKLKLVNGVGYWYFIYDDVKNNIFETSIVQTMCLKDMTIDQWVKLGKEFVSHVETEN